jgi:uncharacterized membrane protein
MKFLASWDLQLTRLSEDRFYLILLTSMAAIIAGLMANFGITLHSNFLTIACDTAEFQNAIINTMHGQWFRNTVYDGPNVLGIHTLFIFLLLAPVYALFPSPNTLFNLQIWSVYSTVIPLYLAAREISGRPLAAFLVAASALLSPMLVHMALAPFHPETWITAAVFWSYYFYRRNRPLAFGIAAGLALSSGEEAAFIYAALGVVLLIIEDGLPWRKRYGAWMLGTAVAWIVLTVGVISPLMHTPGQQNLIAHHYEQWNIESAPGLVFAVLGSPWETFTTLFSPMRWIHIAILIGPPLVLMFFSRSSLILALPLPVYFLMCDREFYLYFHAYYYQFAFFAGYLGLIFFLVRWNFSTRLGVLTMASVFFFNVLALSSAFGLYVTFFAGRDPGFSEVLRDVFAKLPAEAAVYGPHRYCTYLATRDNMVLGDLREENLDFNAMVDKLFPTTDVHASQIDYIVSDLVNDQCGWRQGGYDPELTKLRAANLQHLVQSGQWEVFWNQNNVIILKRVKKS